MIKKIYGLLFVFTLCLLVIPVYINADVLKDENGIYILDKNYLNTLSDSNHKLQVAYTDDNYIDSTNVMENVNINDNFYFKNPDTFDYVGVWIALGVISLIGICGLFIYRKKKKV